MDKSCGSEQNITLLWWTLLNSDHANNSKRIFGSSIDIDHYSIDSSICPTNRIIISKQINIKWHTLKTLRLFHNHYSKLSQFYRLKIFTSRTIHLQHHHSNHHHLICLIFITLPWMNIQCWLLSQDTTSSFPVFHKKWVFL